MVNLRPTYYVKSVAEMNPSEYLQYMPGLQGMAFDLDKTLVGQHEETLPSSHIDTLAAIGELGLRVGLISNAASAERTERVKAMADYMSEIVGSEVVAVTSRMVSGKKKPLRPVFDEFSRRSEILNEHLLFVGDQIFKDILGANRAGYAGTVLVAPYGHGDDWRVKFFQRPVEAAIRPLLGVPFLTKNFSKPTFDKKSRHSDLPNDLDMDND